jgi:hypothetical protein
VKQKSTDVPISCQKLEGLFSPEMRKRHAKIWAKMEEEVLGINETEKGYAFNFPFDDNLFQDLAEYITYERLCCPFFEFTLEMKPADEQVRLQLSGGKGVKEFLRSELTLGSSPQSLPRPSPM